MGLLRHEGCQLAWVSSVADFAPVCRLVTPNPQRRSKQGPAGSQLLPPSRASLARKPHRVARSTASCF